jgi:DNA-binding PadR family transcriptional regulator
VTSEWGLSENNRKAKFYRLTSAGRGQLRAESDRWSRYATAIASVLTASEEGAPA